MLFFNAEIWTITQADRERLEAFEMRPQRGMLKISWVDKVSKFFLQKVQENRSILNTVRQRKLRRLWPIGLYLPRYVNVNVIDFAVVLPPLKKFLRVR